MKAEAVAGIAVVGAMLGAAVVAGRSSASSPSPGPAPGPSGGGGTPALPSASSVLGAGSLPALGAPDHLIVDTAPNGMIASAAIYSAEGGIVDLTNLDPSTGNFDSLRVALSKPTGQGFPAIIVSKRGTQLFAKNATLTGAADIMDLVGASFSQPTPTAMRLDKGPSHMNIFVGLRVTGDPSPNVTALGYGDTRKPMTAAQSKVAPDTAYDLDRDAQRNLGVTPLSGA